MDSSRLMRKNTVSNIMAIKSNLRIRSSCGVIASKHKYEINGDVIDDWNVQTGYFCNGLGR